MKIGNPAIPLLIKELNCGTTESRKKTIELLGKLRAEASLNSLFQIFFTDDTEAKCIVLEAFKQIGEAAVNFLLNEMKSETPDIHFWAVWALGKLKIKEAIEPLILMLNNNDKTVFEILTILINIGNPVIAPLIKHLEGNNPIIKRKAIGILGTLKSSEAINSLNKLLFDEDVIIRQETILAIERIGVKGAAESLFRVIKIDKNENIRKQASILLSKMVNIRAMLVTDIKSTIPIEINKYATLLNVMSAKALCEIAFELKESGMVEIAKNFAYRSMNALPSFNSAKTSPIGSVDEYIELAGKLALFELDYIKHHGKQQLGLAHEILSEAVALLERWSDRSDAGYYFLAVAEKYDSIAMLDKSFSYFRNNSRIIFEKWG